MKYLKNNLDQAINDLNISTILSPTSDLYLRELSTLLLQRANIEANLQNPNTQFIQNLLTYSIQTAQASIFLNPLEPLNYSALANIYENLSPVNQQFYNLAIENYKKASERDPYNPIYYIRMAILHYNNKNKEQGDTELKKAYLLKPNDQQILQLIRQYMIK
ncbi:MAG: tetratricopeptide repeat protein [Minisyncoccia bacterium]|jgi:tetratricopeptide (TPR) repeat protein